MIIFKDTFDIKDKCETWQTFVDQRLPLENKVWKRMT